MGQSFCIRIVRLKNVKGFLEGLQVSTRFEYDITYVTIDSLSEGIGSSQIVPLLLRLAKAGLVVNLISFEKMEPKQDLQFLLKSNSIEWNIRDFRKQGPFAGLSRIMEIKSQITKTKIIHARSDIPAVAASLSGLAPILWDVRSLWADQKAFLEPNHLKSLMIQKLSFVEGIAGFNAKGMSTLTHQIVPELEKRHRRIPELRTVVPTAVDLKRFCLTSNLGDKVKGLYSGTYNNYYDLELSARFISELQSLKRVEVHWARPRESSRNALNSGETSIFEASQTEMASIISNYNFGLSVCKMNAGPSLKAAMPTKVAEFLSCGRPVVLNKGLGDFDEYINEFRAGVILDGSMTDLRQKTKQLIDLLMDPETPFRCRALAEKYFDVDQGALKYMALYQKLIQLH